MIRVVVEVPRDATIGAPGLGGTRRMRTEKDAVWWLRSVLEAAGYPSMGRRVKSFTRVRAGDRAKLVGVDDVGTRLRHLRDELNVIIGDT